MSERIAKNKQNRIFRPRSFCSYNNSQTENMDAVGTGFDP